MFRRIAFGMVSAMALTVSAHAGGMKDGPVAPPEPTWTGFYLGAYGGYGWSESGVASRIDPASAFGVFGGIDYKGRYNDAMSPALYPDGADIGGSAGYNFQAGSIVFGVEGSFGAFHLSDTAATTFSALSLIPAPAVVPVSLLTSTTVETDWLATIRGRVGFTFNRALFYGTGGAAFASANFHQHNLYQTAAGLITNQETASFSDTLTGWTAGGGVEYRLGNNWSAKIEYLHFDFSSLSGSSTITNVAPAPSVSHSASLTADSVRVGLNYRFGSSYAPLY
jgi:outer membrane immunogenic protein